MNWIIIYHRDVENDLKSVGASAARRILRAIDSRLTKDPLQFGSPLSGNLSTFRKFRIGDYRLVYQIINAELTVYVLAVGPRRDKEIYNAAGNRAR